MKAKAKDQDVAVHAGDGEVALGLGWSAALEARSRGATLRLAHPEQGLVAVEITITAQGPVIRASAAVLEIDSAKSVTVRCEDFTVEAKRGIDLRAPEITQEATGTIRAEGHAVEIEARAEDVRIQANDDVKVLGERVLLNCERDEAPPRWVQSTPFVEARLSREDVAGDVELFDEPVQR